MDTWAESLLEKHNKERIINKNAFFIAHEHLYKLSDKKLIITWKYMCGTITKGMPG
jgi:hypothetical protein